MYQSFFELHVDKIRASSGSSQATGTCPFHEDKLASLSFNFATGLWSCHAGCGVGNVLTFARRLGVPAPSQGSNFARSESINGGHSKPAGGLSSSPEIAGESAERERKVVARYIYTDESGQPLFRVNRTDPKGFFQQRFENGNWIGGLKETRRVIYNLPDVLASNQTIFFVEGEKDAERLRTLSLVATTSPMGAGNWDPGFALFFKGKRVCAIPDNDEPGRAYIEKVRRDLAALQVPVKVVLLSGVPEKGDVSDFLDSNGNDVGALLNLVRAARCVGPTEQRQPSRQTPLAYFESIGLNLAPAGSLLPTEYSEFSHRAYSDVTSTIEKLTDDAMVVIEELNGLWMKGVRTAIDYGVCLRLLMELHLKCQASH